MNKALKDAIKHLADVIAQDNLDMVLDFYNNSKVELKEDGISKKQYLQDGEEHVFSFIDEFREQIDKAAQKAYKTLVAVELKKK